MIQIRKASISDIDKITEFQIAMAFETENMFLDNKTVSEGVKKIIENPQIGSYYIAQINNETLGCLLTLYEWSDWRNAFVIWIHSVYVDPHHRGEGVFKYLYGYLKNIVNDDINYVGLRLYVEKKNIKAQKVYEKSGMNKHHYELYEWLK